MEKSKFIAKHTLALLKMYRHHENLGGCCSDAIFGAVVKEATDEGIEINKVERNALMVALMLNEEVTQEKINHLLNSTALDAALEILGPQEPEAVN